MQLFIFSVSKTFYSVPIYIFIRFLKNHIHFNWHKVNPIRMRQTEWFLTQISKTLLEEIDCPLVVGADFNAVVNPALDKSQSDTSANPSSKLLNKFITELNLIDLWRIQNTKSKDFTFFLIDKTFSRIDYIFLSPSLISSNSSISILPILLSDHSAVLCSVPLSDVKAKSPRWHFNITLLSNQTFITSLKEYIKEFLEINMPSDVDPQILWETTSDGNNGVINKRRYCFQ